MTSDNQNTITTAKLIYILMLVSTIIGITGVIALIMAYVIQDDAPEWLQTHYRFQIRTFWIGLLYILIGGFTMAVNIGYFILLFTFVWIVVRCAKGLRQLENRQPVPNPASWLFS